MRKGGAEVKVKQAAEIAVRWARGDEATLDNRVCSLRKPVRLIWKGPPLLPGNDFGV
jgi:hypothetical protein